MNCRPALSRHLKFAIAPVSTPSLPYRFSLVKGGEFKADSWYGSIQRKEFCLVAIVGEKRLPKSSTNGDESEEEEEEQEEAVEEETEEEVEDGDSDSSSDSDKTKDPPGGRSGGQGESTSNEGVEEEGETGGEPLHEEGNEEQDNERVEESKDHEEPQHEEATAPKPSTESKVSTGVVENMTYTGLVYYEKKEAEDLVTFTVAKDLNALLEFIDKRHSRAEVDQDILFRFKDHDGYIELKFDAPQDDPFTGWSIKPHLKPCRFLRCDVDKFGEAKYPFPSRCLISIYASPNAVPSLHYSVPLDGVADPVTLFIHRSMRTAPPPPLTVQGTSSSSSTASISQTRRETEESTFRSDIAHRVMMENIVLIKETQVDLYFLADKLLEKSIINGRERSQVTDEHCGLTADQRLHKLLNIIIGTIRVDGEVFGIFLDILREEGTRRTIKLADKLLEKYNNI
ncbi:PREDICTED: uncharacterized protein LOC109588226 [Amphimedon queenslandica]|uniref:CARD domain-containing protein n=1 Tax=Amphimedon queenslandica TaxID=400682 RepID=A0AAN0JSW4_AMPQE|nr:PREDICTED: uncharacterized protein LOC109588226 [Amphimedon queenslandica]|eukprot:XP_019859963.1 PREDICTED: uncharacterized protein LOC109588226 [Amphimedon queenslandica]